MYARAVHPSTRSLLSFFDYAHLPPDLQAVSKPCGDLAHAMVGLDLDGAEMTAGLRKMLEAKDCFVRALVQAKRERAAADAKATSGVTETP